MVDVSKRLEVREAARLMRKVGVPEVSILINNAAVLYHRPFLNQESDLVEKTFNVNVLSNFWVCSNIYVHLSNIKFKNSRILTDSTNHNVNVLEKHSFELLIFSTDYRNLFTKYDTKWKRTYSLRMQHVWYIRGVPKSSVLFLEICNERLREIFNRKLTIFESTFPFRRLLL